jgi:hypothetical protein
VSIDWPCHWHPDTQTHAHTDTSAPKAEEHYVVDMRGHLPPIVDTVLDVLQDITSLPFPDENTAAEEALGTIPAYETTVPCDEQSAKKRQVCLCVGAVVQKTDWHTDGSTYG